MNAVLPTRAVLAGTDLTAASEPVLRAAAGICARTGATLHVLHAFDLPPSPYLETAPGLASFQERITRTEHALREQVARVVPAGVTLGEVKVEIFAAHRALADHARAVGAELVVIGPHARRELEIGFLGGTADRLLRTLEVPCLVVRGEPRMPPRRVVVPMDLSEWARAALDVALGWAAGLSASDRAAPDAEVSVIHVHPRVLTGPGQPFERAEVMPGWNLALADAARRAPGVRMREEVLWGDRPADEIAAFAEREGADLVVMATHGYGAVKRALLGGTAHGVASRAPCPVLLVPPRMWASETAEPVLHAAELFAPPPV